jgi:hypothetical protein
MAYSIVSAIGRKKGLERGWETVHPANITIQTLINEYQDLLIKLTNPFLADPVIYSLTENREVFTSFTKTFGQWLTDNANVALPSKGKDYNVVRKYAQAGDALRNRYTFIKANPTSHPDMEVPDTSKTDLLMKRSGTDYTLLGKRALVSVNGFFHRTESSPHGLYIRDGRTSIVKARDQVIGLLTFTNIADCQIIPITPGMIFRGSPTRTLYNGAFINLGVPTENKSVMICLGGYLHAGHDAYKVTGNGIVCVDFTRIPLLQRIYESRRFIDLSAIEDFWINGLGDNLPNTNLHSDNFIKAYLGLSQSFAVVMDAPALVSEKRELAYSQLPGVFVSHEEPKDWLVSRFGRTLTYLHRKEESRWSITTQLDYDYSQLVESTSWPAAPSVCEGRDPNRDWRNSKARWNKLYVETLTITPT